MKRQLATGVMSSLIPLEWEKLDPSNEDSPYEASQSGQGGDHCSINGTSR